VSLRAAFAEQFVRRFVIPPQAGIQILRRWALRFRWIPAGKGMTS